MLVPCVGQLIGRCYSYSDNTKVMITEAERVMAAPPDGVNVDIVKALRDQLVKLTQELDEKNKVHVGVWSSDRDH